MGWDFGELGLLWIGWWNVGWLGYCGLIGIMWVDVDSVGWCGKCGLNGKNNVCGLFNSYVFG